MDGRLIDREADRYTAITFRERERKRVEGAGERVGERNSEVYVLL